MQLLSENKLIWSPTVANSRMNRDRNSSGINSYERELKFKPEQYLESKIKECGKAAWLDLCCGQGNALIQTVKYLRKHSLEDKITLVGIDLLDTFSPHDKESYCLEFKSMPVIEWIPDKSYDLITCVHGLHYLGDKLKIIEVAVSALTSSGLFIANLDMQNISINSARSNSNLKTLFTETGLIYDSRKKLLKKNGFANIKFSLEYLGADDNHGPNYTGQDSVTSYYSV